ncbi:hypothetical protein ACFFUE_02575 [Bergeyella porcorum]|uniref:hypothetical protein n=1 Tax=Bergeyella porcorum TaxID=1735111 RepID=UPI0035E62713
MLEKSLFSFFFSLFSKKTQHSKLEFGCRLMVKTQNSALKTQKWLTVVGYRLFLSIGSGFNPTLNMLILKALAKFTIPIGKGFQFSAKALFS